MKLLGPTRHVRLNEAIAVVFLLVGLCYVLALVSYHQSDPSFDTAVAAHIRPQNLIGRAGANVSDLSLQLLGLGSFAIPVLLLALAWKWLRSDAIDGQVIKIIGGSALVFAACTGCTLLTSWRPFGGAIPVGGMVGLILADYLLHNLNPTGAILTTAATLILSLYLVSTFSMSKLAVWFAGPIAFFHARWVRFQSWREIRRHRRQETKLARQAEKEARLAEKRSRAEMDAAALTGEPAVSTNVSESLDDAPERTRRMRSRREPKTEEQPVPYDGVPFDPTDVPIVENPMEKLAPVSAAVDDIPIRPLAEYKSPVQQDPQPEPAPALPIPVSPDGKPRRRTFFRMPDMQLLSEPQGRSAYDSAELKEIAARIKAKLEEFNVLGSVVQINPGPVVTTFEFKPEAGIKYSRITSLTEDLCLGLQAESVLIERIPGKPTVGIEVPNSNREVISLREILESDEFRQGTSPLTISLGKDINGRIKVAALETMPHLLIAGSTGSGKSVMLNTMIMSLLYKSSPNELRMIMIDPKRVELGIYEGIPHLLTPVITEPKKATNALKNAVLEMERRLKLLASHGVRNIDQFNKKVKQLQRVPRSLFEDDTAEDEELQPLPYILILIDELADLMMLERANVEEAVTRLAQMARAVGIHLVLATQRPSVDVITGLIKANFPARISFRVATRVDSRTILDVMGSEHLLGKGDMLLLPPGSSRLVRVHAAYVSETEINNVVEFWKDQAAPEYDQSFLAAPPSEDGEEADDEGEEFDGAEDPMYQDAVRVVLEMGKASTSTLQRRLRLGYGRAARILDMMQREGIIGPPDGSRPREVLKRPDWLEEIDHQMR